MNMIEQLEALRDRLKEKLEAVEQCLLILRKDFTLDPPPLPEIPLGTKRQAAAKPKARNSGGELTPQVEQYVAGLVGEFNVLQVCSGMGLDTKDNKLKFRIRNALHTLKRRKQIVDSSYGKFKLAQTQSEPPPAESKPRINRNGASRVIDSECAKAMRRAIALVTTNQEKFNRDDMCTQMNSIVGERVMKGWLQSGSVPATLVALREYGMVTLIEHKPPAQAVYTKGERFESVTE